MNLGIIVMKMVFEDSVQILEVVIEIDIRVVEVVILKMSLMV